jgi:Ca-activated chloride channel homolog
MGNTWHFEMTRPLWFAALAVLPLLVVYWRRTLVQFPRRQRITSLLVRSLLLVLVVAALAGPKLTGPTSQEQVVAVVDESRSTGTSVYQVLAPFAAAAQQAKCATSGFRFEGECSPFPFASKEQVLEDRMHGRPATNIAAAIASARAAIPGERVGKILLLSDGNETEGNALAAAKAAGVPVFAVPVPSVDPEVHVASVTAPAEVRQGERIFVNVVVRATGKNEGTLRLLCSSGTLPEGQPPSPPAPLPKGEGRLLEARPVQLVASDNRFCFSHVVGEGPMITFIARIEGCKDTLKDNNEGGCVVMVGPRPRVLLVESQSVLAEPLARALKGENVEVEVRPPQELPGQQDELGRYDLVILSNVPASALPPERMEALRGYVRDAGGGLVVIGGDQSLTAGGYHGTVLEGALPVVCKVEKPKPKPSLAMVLVLDISGSMNEGPKGRRSIELAKQAVARAVEAIDPRDQVGVLVFEDNSRWIIPLGAAADKQTIIDRVNRIEAAGGTTMYPALEQAYLALHDAYADQKHIIVMTDGASNPGDFDGLTQQIAAHGITVSTVGVGNEPIKPLLQNIANKARGHAYFCADARELPRIFEMETRGASKYGLAEGVFAPKVVHSAQALSGLDFQRAPRLLGYVETTARPEAHVVLSSDQGDPLLVIGRCGQGTTAAFTSDITSRWASAWLRWPEFGKFWVQLVRQTMRNDTFRTVRLHAEPAGDRLLVTLDAADRAGKFLNDGAATVSVSPLPLAGDDHFVVPAGVRAARSATLSQVAPGRYAAAIPLPSPGPCHVEAKFSLSGQPAETAQFGLVVPYAEEFRIRPTNTTLLKAIAEATGGKYDPKPEDVFAPSGKTVPQTWLLWPWVLGAALGVFVIDLTLKRVRWRG